MKAYLDALVNYAADCGLIEDEDRVYALNRLLELMELDSAGGEGTVSAPLNEILDALCDDMDADRDALCKALSAVGYAYDAARNQFI